MTAKEYIEPMDIKQFRIMIDQLSFAVDRYKGKTTITNGDIRTMKIVLEQLARYDRMAHRG